MTFDLQKGFPLITTKKVFIRGIFEELIFFLKGNTNSKLLEEKNVNIWKPNTTQEFINSVGLEYKEGDMGPMYGFNWKHFGAEYIDCDTDYTNKGFNQIEYVFDLLINDPMSRRIIMTDYNPSVAKYGVLYPCHSIVIQFYVKPVNDKLYVSMNMYQRSVDVFLGEVFNIASNALLLHLVCNTLNAKTNSEKYIADKLTIVMGDIHIYEQHITAVKEQLQRIPYAFPKLYIKNSYSNIEDYKWEDIEVINYQSHPAIKAPMIA
jgi:thymidylate synthase